MLACNFKVSVKVILLLLNMNFCKKLCVSFVEDYHVVVFLCLVAADGVCHYYLLMP